jgi:hypothetical protein
MMGGVRMAQTVQLEQLPEAARHELLDFYEFLMQKYVVSGVKSSKRVSKKPVLEKADEKSLRALQALAGIWKERHISLESLRQSAWQRQP